MSLNAKGIMHECILAFESESYDSHVIVRAKARLFKSRILRFTSEAASIFDDKVG